MNEISVKEFYYNTVVPSHEGQKYGNRLYTYHLQEVRKEWIKLYGGENFSNSQFAELACLGHDLLEDCPKINRGTLEVLGLPEKVIHAIVLVTKLKGYDYRGYLSDISEDELAFQVKVADTYSNMTQCIKDGDYKRVEKYTEQLKLLHLYRKEYLSFGETSFIKDKLWCSNMSKSVHGG